MVALSLSACAEHDFAEEDELGGIPPHQHPHAEALEPDADYEVTAEQLEDDRIYEAMVRSAAAEGDELMAQVPANLDSRFNSRELSWLAFNERVLAQALDTRHPLLERLRFLSISHSNLDEFFMVRVAALSELVRTGMSDAAELRVISDAAMSLMADQGRIWKLLKQELEDKAGIFVVQMSQLDEADKEYLHTVFLNEFWPQLTATSVDASHPLPFIANKGMGLLLTLQHNDDQANEHDGVYEEEERSDGMEMPLSGMPAGGSSGSERAKKKKGTRGRDAGHGASGQTGHAAAGPANARYRHGTLPREMSAMILLPPRLPRFIQLPSRKAAPAATVNATSSGGRTRLGTASPSGTTEPIRFVLAENVIHEFAHHFFADYTVQGKAIFRVLRDSEILVDEEAVDLVRMFETALKKRRKGRVIRLTINAAAPESIRLWLAEKMDVPRDVVSLVDGLVGLSDVRQLIVDDRKNLQFPSFQERFPERIRQHGGDVFAAIRAKDIIVHHPFESFGAVLAFIRQAARDPQVVTIKQTLYRTSEDSPIVRSLIEAAEAGKVVTALIELKARFDEEANIRWSRDLERAGVHVVYGFIELKTHAKVALVVRKEDGQLNTYVHFGTGNYHPQTARVYTDLSLFTAHPGLGRDAMRLFSYMTSYGQPKDLEFLAVAPFSLRSSIYRHIRDEIANARAGKPAAMLVKMNALVDERLINLLYEASESGVDIYLIIRGMCSLRPGIPGLSSRIRVKSLVGRFLEHTRAIAFANGSALPSANAKVFISSADWMTRNLDWRVEALVPILNPTVHRQVLYEVLLHSWTDQINSWWLLPDGEYIQATNGTDLSTLGGKPGGIAVGSGGEAAAAAGAPKGGSQQQQSQLQDSHAYFLTHDSLSGRGDHSDFADGATAALRKRQRDQDI